LKKSLLKYLVMMHLLRVQIAYWQFDEVKNQSTISQRPGTTPLPIDAPALL
jgi:hypothetical protein